MNDVNLEAGKVEIAEYTKTEAALSILRDDYSVIPDCETDEGYEFVKSGIKEVAKFRTSLEAARKKAKQPHLEKGRILDKEAKRITDELLKLENPMKAAKSVIDDREAKAKQDRLDSLNDRILQITALQNVRGMNSAEIEAIMERVGTMDTTTFYEMSMEAAKAIASTSEYLAEAYSERLSFEAAERDAAAARAEAKKAQSDLAKARQEMAQIEREKAAMTDERATRAAIPAIEAGKADAIEVNQRKILRPFAFPAEITAESEIAADQANLRELSIIGPAEVLRDVERIIRQQFERFDLKIEVK